MKIAGIILAAGLSSRMGMVKSLLPFGKTLLLDLVIKNAHLSDLSSIIVVLGHEAERIKKNVNFLDAEIIFNPDYSMGQSSSLNAGLKAIAVDTDGAMFILGDQPFVNWKTINSLISAFREQPSSLTIPTFSGKRGNPVVVHRRIFPMIRQLTGDTGARSIFHTLNEQTMEVEVSDRGIHLDIDTLDDYRKLTRIFENNQGEELSSKSNPSN